MTSVRIRSEGVGMTFAAQLRKLRTDLGLTQAQAAELLGLSRGAIAYYEAGKRQPPDEPIRSKDQVLADLRRLARDDKQTRNR